jgi:hypothetical protein
MNLHQFNVEAHKACDSRVFDLDQMYQAIPPANYFLRSSLAGGRGVVLEGY